jgi:hypothetical protein
MGWAADEFATIDLGVPRHYRQVIHLIGRQTERPTAGILGAYSVASPVPRLCSLRVNQWGHRRRGQRRDHPLLVTPVRCHWMAMPETYDRRKPCHPRPRRV